MACFGFYLVFPRIPLSVSIKQGIEIALHSSAAPSVPPATRNNHRPRVGKGSASSWRSQPLFPFPFCSLLSSQPATSASSPSARTCARQSTPCAGTLTCWRAPCLPSCPPSTWPHGSPSPTPGSAPTPSMARRSKWGMRLCRVCRVQTHGQPRQRNQGVHN